MQMRESWHEKRAGEWISYWNDEKRDPSAPYRLTDCIELSGDEKKDLELDFVIKESIKIVLDGQHLVTLLALPGELRELAAGFLICAL